MHILFQDCVSEFLGQHLLLAMSALKEKYEGCSDVIRTGQQVREWVSLCVSVVCLSPASHFAWFKDFFEIFKQEGTCNCISQSAKLIKTQLLCSKHVLLDGQTSEAKLSPKPENARPLIKTCMYGAIDWQKKGSLWLNNLKKSCV